MGGHHAAVAPTPRGAGDEPFSEANLGRQLRTLARVLHTGEVGGVLGQLVAGLASTGAAFLVWTGVSLAWRRIRTWPARRHGRAVDPSITELGRGAAARTGTPTGG
jgi:uncharacterized iron-regulated membrane protein